MGSSKRIVSINPDHFDGPAPALLDHNLKREKEATVDGAIIDDVGVGLKEAPEWLFSLLEEQAESRNVDMRHMTRALSERLPRPCGDPELSLCLLDTYRTVRKHANNTVNRDLKDLLKIPSGYYFSPSDKYRDNKPLLHVYGWAKEELVNMARITGDEDWTVVALSNLCVCLCEFGSVSAEHKDLLRRHEQRRRVFLRWRYNALLGFVPKDAPLWLKVEVEMAVKRYPGLKFAEVARAVGFQTDTDATRKKLLRLLNILRKSDVIRLENRRYYPNEK